MRQLVVIATLLVFAAGCSKPDPASEKAAVESVVKGVYSAIEKSDLTALKGCFTPDVSGFEEGEAYSLDSFLDVIRMVEPGSFTYTMEFIRTDLGKDFAHCIVRSKGTYIFNKMPVELDAYETNVLKKIDGKWVIFAYHSTHFGGPKKLASGCVMGLHTPKLELKPGVTMEQVVDFRLKKFIPAFNKLTDEMQIIQLHGIRGEGNNQFAYMLYFASESMMNSYFEAEGKPSPKAQELFKKMAPLYQERDKLYTTKADPYTDWKVY